jgi:hypothetical protein
LRALFNGWVRCWWFDEYNMSFPIIAEIAKRLRVAIVVHPLNWTQGQNKIDCVLEGVRDGTDKKEF